MMPVTPDVSERMAHLLPLLMQVGPGQPPPEEVGLSRAQVALLAQVGAAPDCSLQGLADGLGLTPPTVSVGVRRLEEAGLVGRQPDPDDGRAWQFCLTAAGEALWQRIQHYRRDRARVLLAGLTPEEQMALVALLEKALHAHGAVSDIP